MYNIGKKIKQRRNELGWSQRELAAKMGYSNHTTLTRIESGKVDVSQTKIVQFAEVLNTTIAYLMDWEEVEKNNDTITDAVVKMRTNEEFLTLIERLIDLDDEQIKSVNQMLNAFIK